ncbi:glycosyltransferase [Anaerostipes butyraticus]|uniref:glycosyltransferase n=1 Tax=Anaerostipes butyraticus TaxID=645466 RepID=UPI0035EAB835
MENIRNQTFTNIEVIMVNGGSTDNSGEICKEFAEKDSRFIYLYQENSGVSDARNYGGSIVTGYLLYCVSGCG